jgi:hypothetical protein
MNVVLMDNPGGHVLRMVVLERIKYFSLIEMFGKQIIAVMDMIYKIKHMVLKSVELIRGDRTIKTVSRKRKRAILIDCFN